MFISKKATNIFKISMPSCFPPEDWEWSKNMNFVFKIQKWRSNQWIRFSLIVHETCTLYITLDYLSPLSSESLCEIPTSARHLLSLLVWQGSCLFWPIQATIRFWECALPGLLNYSPLVTLSSLSSGLVPPGDLSALCQSEAAVPEQVAHFPQQLFIQP